jgi:hypothetical protein
MRAHRGLPEATTREIVAPCLLDVAGVGGRERKRVTPACPAEGRGRAG